MTRVCLNLTFDTTMEQTILALKRRVADTGIVVHGMAVYRPYQ